MDPRFEQVLHAAGEVPSRRAVLRGLAGVLAAAGLGAALASDGEATRNRRRRRRRQRQRRRRECSGRKPCEAPLNPCQEAVCKKRRCKTRTLSNGTDCGDGLVCQDGACLCPDGICTVHVTSSNLSNWHGFDGCVCGEVDDSILTFRIGPATPPYGTGSVELTAPDSSSVSLATFQFANTLLSDITDLRYSTYQSLNGPASAVGKLSFAIDFFGSNPSISFDSLIYDPVANGLAVEEDTWQEWDAISGGAALWLYDGGGDWPNTNPPIPATDLLSWAQIVATYPDARIQFSDTHFSITLDADPDSFTEAINSVTFGTTLGTTRFVFGQNAS